MNVRRRPLVEWRDAKAKGTALLAGDEVYHLTAELAHGAALAEALAVRGAP